MYGLIYWTLINLYLINYDPPGDYSRVPTGTRSGIVRAPVGLRPDPLQAETGPHRLPPGYLGGSGRVPCVLSFKICPRVPGGSRQRPRLAPVGQFTGLIRDLFIAGARVTFKLELKVTRGPREVKKNGPHPVGVPPGPVRDGQKKTKNSPGRPLLWIVNRA